MRQPVRMPNQAFKALAIARWDVPPAAGRPLMQRCAVKDSAEFRFVGR